MALWKHKSLVSGVHLWSSYLEKWSPIVFSSSLELLKKKQYGIQIIFSRACYVDKSSQELPAGLAKVLPIKKWVRYKKPLQSEALLNQRKYRVVQGLCNIIEGKQAEQIFMVGYPIVTSFGNLWALLSLNIQKSSALHQEILWIESLVDILGKWIEQMEKDSHKQVAIEKQQMEEQLTEQKHLQHFIVHQMKSPVVAAQNQLQQLEEQSQNLSEEKNLSQNIKESYKALSVASSSINQYLHILQEKNSFKVQTVSLKQVWEQIHKTYDSLKNFDVYLPVFDKDSKDSNIKGNLAQCFIVLESLIENAKKATQSKGWVRIEEIPKLDFCEVWVRDSGPGIPIEKVTKVFEPFYTTCSEGHGLGLFYCKQILEKMGATIQYTWNDFVEQRGFCVKFAYAPHDI